MTQGPSLPRYPGSKTPRTKVEYDGKVYRPSDRDLAILTVLARQPDGVGMTGRDVNKITSPQKIYVNSHDMLQLVKSGLLHRVARGKVAANKQVVTAVLEQVRQQPSVAGVFTTALNL